MRTQCVTLQFNRGKLRFSAGHFTMFSATDREPLHGHNYWLEARLKAGIGSPGITFDYRIFEEKLIALCRRLHLHCLMPTESPFLTIEARDRHYHIQFDQDTMLLPKTDVVLLPLANISVESLSQWFVDELAKDQEFLTTLLIREVVVAVFNGPAHGAEAILTLVD